jgi:hypothetical protein
LSSPSNTTGIGLAFPLLILECGSCVICNVLVTAGDLPGQSQIADSHNNMLSTITAAAAGTQQLPSNDGNLPQWTNNSSSRNDATYSNVDAKQQQLQQLTVKQLHMYRQKGVLPAWHELPSWARNNTRRAMSEILAATARSKASKSLLLEGIHAIELVYATYKRACNCV